MQRKTAKDFDQELLVLFDAYVHGSLDRRGFLEAAQKFAVGGVTSMGLLAALSPDFANAQVIAKDDKRLLIQMLEFASPLGHQRIKVYMARPVNLTGKLPGILIGHENRGLNPHIEDIARRIALEGYIAFAPDALTSLDGYPGNEDKARELFNKLEQNKITEDFISAAGALASHRDCSGKIGAVGFCWGGGMVHKLAIRLTQLSAAVPFYGDSPPPSEAAKVKSQMMMHFAGIDDRINKPWPAYEEALKAAGVTFTVHHYLGTQHGFNNDTTPRFSEPEAKLAWGRTMDFFAKTLRN